MFIISVPCTCCSPRCYSILFCLWHGLGLFLCQSCYMYDFDYDFDFMSPHGQFSLEDKPQIITKFPK